MGQNCCGQSLVTLEDNNKMMMKPIESPMVVHEKMQRKLEEELQMISYGILSNAKNMKVEFDPPNLDDDMEMKMP